MAVVRSIEGRSGLLGRLSPARLDVVLADGHDELPSTDVPVVVQTHEAGWFTDELREVLSPGFFEFIAPRTEKAVRRADRVITPSMSAARDMADAYGLGIERFSPVPHGVDPWFHPMAEGGSKLVASARGGKDAPYVLFAATLHPRKNLPAVREAMNRLVRDGAPHVLVIAGGGAPDRADSTDLEREARSDLPDVAGRVVRMADPSDAELAALMAEADAFCLPSLYEGFGLTALEAMASGTPVVVSDRGALPEVVGDAGLVVPPDVDAVEDALGRVLSEPDLAATLRRKGLDRARTYTWRRTAEGWLAALRIAAGREYTRGA